MAYVFYDVETTGLDTRFDQLISFAAIRTDANLSEIDRFQCEARLLPHIVPDPEALLLNGTSLDELRSVNRPTHYEAVRRIRSKLESWSPALFIGYNSIRFDEEVLRQAFYQTLHPPFLTSMQGNGRADALTLVRTVAFLRPGGLQIPLDEAGHRCCRLTEVAAANGWSESPTHSAITDAERTLQICRRVAEVDWETWSRFQRFSTKAAVDDLLDTEDAFLCIRFRGNEAEPAIASCIGRDPTNRNARPCVPLESFVPATLDNALFDSDIPAGVASEIAASVFRLKSNGCPVICSLDDTPAGLVDDVNLEGLIERGAALRANEGLCQQIVAAAAQSYPIPDRPMELEERIYESFISEADALLLQDFHEAAWEERKAILRKITDDRLRKLGQRLLFIERPDLQTAEDRERYEAAIAKRLRPDNPSAAPWRTINQAEEGSKTS